MKTILIEKTGGADVLQWVDRDTPIPGVGEALVRHAAIGLNFIDIYFRTGLYPAKLPLVPGSEAAGVVEAVGDNVTRVKPGDRVAYAYGSGAYAEWNVVAADKLVQVPSEVSLRIAAAALLKGMTAEFLADRVAKELHAGDIVLLHAAAGGVGVILTQWLKHKGLTVIATAGGERKVKVARSHGADYVIDYEREDVAGRVRDITGGAGVRVAFDSVGKATFESSLNSLGRRGLMVTFGNASGPAPAIEPARLSRLGSLFLTRPTLFDYVATTDELDGSAKALFDLIKRGVLKIDIGQTWPLAEAKTAHEALEGRKTIGASLLIP